MSSPDNDNGMMTFGNHLEVMRRMTFRILGVSVSLAVIIFCMKDMVWQWILAPSRPDFVVYQWIKSVLALTHSGILLDDFHVNMIATELSSQFMVHMTTSFCFGLLLASPYIVFELFRFISPALYESEKKTAVAVMLCVYVLFIVGLVMNYFILFPLAFRFLGTYQVSSVVTSNITLDSYISTFLSLSLVMGCIFQLPIIAYFAGKMGFVSADMLAKYRRHAIIIIATLSAIITPPDIFSCILVIFPLYGLYEISIIIIRKVESKLA